jgi:hypothetical protein
LEELLGIMATMKRKLKWIAVFVLVLFVGLGVVLFLLPRDRITVESWEKIEIGMTEKEVEEMLGGPGTNEKNFWEQFRTFQAIFDGRELFEPEGAIGVVSEKYWVGRRGYMVILFREEGRVEAKVFQGWRSTDPTFLDRLRDWLGW